MPSKNLGGIGPSYDQTIQVIAHEALCRVQENPDYSPRLAVEDVGHGLSKECKPTGEQYGAALQLLYLFLQEEDVPLKEPTIWVTRTWPQYPAVLVENKDPRAGGRGYKPHSVAPAAPAHVPATKCTCGADMVLRCPNAPHP